ncbi:MAG TPA: L-rhamnose mutarotase [Steroidobacteraceae bacterium]|nr:L-rhamnose mutarotase [Steroidobacteraceae bacterium]
MNNTRQCFTVNLRNDPEAIKRYTEFHKPGGPPAAVTKALRDCGITVMEIYLIANHLFMIMEVNEQYSPELRARIDATTPEVQAWATLMNTMQVALPIPANDAGAGNWRRLECIYRLSDQP